MKTNELLLTLIVAAAILATPSVLTSPVLAQVPPGTDTAGGTTDTADENQGTTGGTTAADESPSELYQTFQSCLSEAEGTENFADEQEIRGCFIEAGYIQGTDDANEDEDDNEEENEDSDEETN